MANQGTKRKHDHESSDSESLPKSDTEIMSKAKEIMKQVTEISAQTIMMHRDIMSKMKKMNNNSRKKATIGILGKSGEGKSSLSSAVLGQQDLLTPGCFGACTAVVTQVEANVTDSNYTAEIELFSKEEWENELKDLLKDLSAEGEDRNEELVEIAEEKIRALYGEDADKKTLEELKKDDTYAKVEMILSDSKKTISSSDVSNFTDDVACYMVHSEASSGGWCWPIVKSVTIRVPDCRELLENIVLVDIPGTGDCNKTRDDKWKSKLRDCSSVWIVSDINRAITDREPWGILKHCIEELGPGGECKHINFICTKTDKIKPGAYMRLSRLTSQISGDEDEKKKKCIIHRNEHAKTRVKEKFENSEIKKRFRTNDDFLKVFTVSAEGFLDQNSKLEPSETEIPKLQDDLRSLNKSITRELTRDYVNEAKGVLSLIQSVHLDKEKNKVLNETKVKARIQFENSLMKALNDLEKCFDGIYNDLEQRLSMGVDESVRLCVASTKAMIAPDPSNGGFHNTLQALCKNGGCYWSRKKKKVLDLNKELAKHLHESINEYFSQIFPVTGKTGKSVQEQIDKFSIIQSDSDLTRSPIFYYIQVFIEFEESKLKALLNSEVVEKKKDIYSSITRTIENQMTSCYKQATALTGQGSMKKKQDLIIATVDETKQHMYEKAKMEMLKNFKNLKLYIMDALESGLKSALELSLSQTSNIKSIDVSREIEELERLSELLSD